MCLPCLLLPCQLSPDRTYIRQNYNRAPLLIKLDIRLAQKDVDDTYMQIEIQPSLSLEDLKQVGRWSDRLTTD